MAGFPYATATVAQIEGHARGLVGRTLIDIQPDLAPMRPSSSATKGVVGHIYEACFDIPRNSLPGPDFIAAGIELKSVPIMRVGSEAKAKERISVGMIDFEGLLNETWRSAAVRKKLERMLLIFYGWEPLQPIARFRTLAAGIWSPDPETWKAIEADWHAIWSMTRAGRRNEVSEGLTHVLGAATKGAGHGSISRAWSLKQPFVSWIYRSMIGKVQAPEPTTVADPVAAFEADIVARCAPHIGRSLDVLATLMGRADKAGKGAVSAIVRTLVGERTHGRHGDFERFGIEVKTVPVDQGGRIVEAMSFPAFVHEELVFETWEDSDLLGRLNRILMVPVHRARGATLAHTTLGRPFFWSPSESELLGIQQEWETFRKLIESGKARELPTAAETEYIHVRPKSRNALDRELAPGGFDVVRKCFWLNQGYLARILAENVATAPR